MVECNTINVRGYGNLQNAIGNQTRSLTPEVGMGVTKLGKYPLSTRKIASKAC